MISRMDRHNRVSSIGVSSARLCHFIVNIRGAASISKKALLHPPFPAVNIGALRGEVIITITFALVTPFHDAAVCAAIAPIALGVLRTALIDPPDSEAVP
jgi:hypothetical protein